MFKLPQTPIFCPYDVGYYIFSVRLYELNSREPPLPSNAAPSSDDSDECSEVACSYAQISLVHESVSDDTVAILRFDGDLLLC